MLRRNFFFYVVVPLGMLAAYLVSVRVVPTTRSGLLFAENGVFELATAAFFCLAGCLAFGLCLRTRGNVPNRYRAAFVVFALAAWFVTLEELSYGQHLCGWKSPEWFAEHSSKRETNLHNLYGDGISNVLRGIAGLGFPFGFLVVPLVAMTRSNAYQPGRWSYYLLPRNELVTVILVAQSLTLLENLSKWMVGASLLVRPGEVQEFFWAMSAAVYVVVLRRRLPPPPAQKVAPVVLKFQFEPRELRRAA